MFEAKRAIVRRLRESWPDSETLTPSCVSPALPSRTFVEAAQALQDQGLIMYEVLLVGAGAEPMLRGAMLTRKGQFWGADLERVSADSTGDGCYLRASCEP